MAFAILFEMTSFAYAATLPGANFIRLRLAKVFDSLFRKRVALVVEEGDGRVRDVTLLRVNEVAIIAGRLGTLERDHVLHDTAFGSYLCQEVWIREVGSLYRRIENHAFSTIGSVDPFDVPMNKDELRESLEDYVQYFQTVRSRRQKDLATLPRPAALLIFQADVSGFAAMKGMTIGNMDSETMVERVEHVVKLWMD